MKSKHKKLKKFLLISSIILLLTFLISVLTITYFYNKYDLDTDKLTSLNNGICVVSASGNDNSLYNTNRSIVEIETLPEYVINAFIDIEDKRFYSHHGYDLKRIIKASAVNLVNHSKAQGASTISQQLIKNALLSNEKTYARKIKEVVLAAKMEKKFSKKEIMEMYLNTIYFGSNAFGIENASKAFFNKSANDLTLNEACCLAGIIKSPNYYSPKINKENANKRKNTVALAMFKNNHISEEEYTQIITSDINIVQTSDFDHSYEEEAIYQACSLLNISERELINKKYKIITYKNEDLQKSVAKANYETLSHIETENDINLDGLSVVTDKNGHILAYYTNSPYNLHNLKRQPASTFKPLAVYLPCLIHNILTPATKLLDEEINYSGFSPKNADKQFHGYVSARYALANSLNIPAVKALDYVGLKKAKETLCDLGINLTQSDMNLSLALGSVKNGINLLDLLAAYNAAGSLGEYSSLSFVDKILDANDNIIYQNDPYKHKVADAESCFMLTDMLKESTKTGTAKRLNSLNIPIASKTGTAGNNNYNTDLYNIAYTTEHSLLTWIANIKDGKLPSFMHSSNQPTQINKEICQYLYSNNAPSDFPIPEGIKKMPYDTLEYENNNKIVAPTQNLERYISYDYFKVDSPPEDITYNSLHENLTLDSTGVKISFNAKQNLSYNIYKITNNKKELLSQIKDKNEVVTLHDNIVFKYDKITYQIENEDNEILKTFPAIRPKDYLINKLNNDILFGKKKWFV